MKTQIEVSTVNEQVHGVLISSPETPLPQNVAAQSSPKVIDYFSSVYDCASKATKYGREFVGRKGKQNLFGLVCDEVKSRLGMAQENMLDSEHVASIKNAIAAFWQSRANELLNEYEVTSVNYDKPKLRLDDSGKALPVEIHATMKGQRKPKDKLELYSMTKNGLEIAKKRLEFMKDNLSKFEPADIRKQTSLVEQNEKILLGYAAEFEVNK